MGRTPLHGHRRRARLLRPETLGRHSPLRRRHRPRPNFLRVQVKSTTCRTGTGYFCQFKPHYLKKQDYTLAQLDLFAAYVIPVEAWYIIPAALLLGELRKTGIMLYPVEPLKKDRYSYEAYKEAWPLLYKSRRALVERVRMHGKNIP